MWQCQLGRWCGNAGVALMTRSKCIYDIQDVSGVPITGVLHHCHNAAELALNVAKAAAEHYPHRLQGLDDLQAALPVEGDIAYHLPPLIAARSMMDIQCTSRPDGVPDPVYNMLACMHEGGLGVGFKLWQLLRRLQQHPIEHLHDGPDS